MSKICRYRLSMSNPNCIEKECAFWVEDTKSCVEVAMYKISKGKLGGKVTIKGSENKNDNNNNNDVNDMSKTNDTTKTE